MPRVGYAVVLLTACLGSASGAPTLGLAASSHPSAVRQPAATESLPAARATIAVTIPCVSGTCELRIPAPPAAPPARQRPLHPTPAAQAPAER
ncbi:MAG TPA: hypothetical protein VHG93_15055 [Longimicrobium sp.]|nr:hypothetical protein [Longimicrobium sp.]